MPWVIHVNSIYHCGVLTVTIVVIIFRVRVVTATSNPSDSWCKSGPCGTTQVTPISCGPETRTRNFGLWAQYVTITLIRHIWWRVICDYSFLLLNMLIKLTSQQEFHFRLITTFVHSVGFEPTYSSYIREWILKWVFAISSQFLPILWLITPSVPNSFMLAYNWLFQYSSHFYL